MDTPDGIELIKSELMTDELIMQYTNPVQQVSDSQLLLFDSFLTEDLYSKMKCLQDTLSYREMADLTKKEELTKLPLITDDKVKLWIDSNEYFEKVIGSITDEIKESTKNFDIKITDMYIKDAYPSEEDLDEFVIMVKVPSGTDIDIINEFWEYIGIKSTEFLDEQFKINPDIADVDEKLIIVVREEEN